MTSESQFKTVLFQEGLWAQVFLCLADRDIACLQGTSKQCNQATKAAKIFVVASYNISLSKVSPPFRKAVEAIPLPPLATAQEKIFWENQIREKMVDAANVVCKFLSQSVRIGLKIPNSTEFSHCSLDHLDHIIKSVQRLPVNEVNFE